MGKRGETIKRLTHQSVLVLTPQIISKLRNRQCITCTDLMQIKYLTRNKVHTNEHYVCNKYLAGLPICALGVVNVHFDKLSHQSLITIARNASQMIIFGPAASEQSSSVRMCLFSIQDSFPKQTGTTKVHQTLNRRPPKECVYTLIKTYFPGTLAQQKCIWTSTHVWP